MKFRKLTALFLATVTAVSLSVSASAGYVKEGEAPLIDIKQSVKGEFRRENPDGTGRAYLYNEKGEIIKGKSIVYLDLSSEYELAFRMRMHLFDKETGQFKAKTYTGFTKEKKGRRYYANGERIIGWYKVGNNWYHFNKDGYADTGKVKIAGVRYTFDEKGRWTGKVAKSGLAPKDFNLEIKGSLGSYGFSTNGTLSYGYTYDGLYTTDIKISKLDKQVFWSMYQESGMEALNGTAITEKYLYDVTLKSDYLKDAPETLEVRGSSAPSSDYTIKASINGKEAVIIYEPDVGHQLIHFDEKAYTLHNLTTNLLGYYKALKAKYPPDKNAEFCEYD